MTVPLETNTRNTMDVFLSFSPITMVVSICYLQIDTTIVLLFSLKNSRTFFGFALRSKKEKYFFHPCNVFTTRIRAFFKDFPVGGGAFFEKGSFCEIIY